MTHSQQSQLDQAYLDAQPGRFAKDTAFELEMNRLVRKHWSYQGTTVSVDGWSLSVIYSVDYGRFDYPIRTNAQREAFAESLDQSDIELHSAYAEGGETDVIDFLNEECQELIASEIAEQISSRVRASLEEAA